MLAWPRLLRPFPMPSEPRLAWLFDVDGTLLVTGGASRGAFAGAVRDLLDVEDDLSDIAFAGRTEPLILADILRKHDHTLRDGDEARFWNAVFDRMPAALDAGSGRVLPGVHDLLDRVAAEPGWVVGLLTGNMTEMARIKLAHYGLAGRFAFGAYGEQAPDRDALACAAVARVAETFGVPARRCVIVGDTEHDITCARAAGARVVAVATGGRSREVLERSRPDLMLDDLTDTEPLMAWAKEIAAGH
jgi:phosphoglycolate phosphatase